VHVHAPANVSADVPDLIRGGLFDPAVDVFAFTPTDEGETRHDPRGRLDREPGVRGRLGVRRPAVGLQGAKPDLHRERAEPALAFGALDHRIVHVAGPRVIGITVTDHHPPPRRALRCVEGDAVSTPVRLRDGERRERLGRGLMGARGREHTGREEAQRLHVFVLVLSMFKTPRILFRG
jgi:hypothetical protein